jgi:Phosphotransferase enzyme family
MEDLKMIEGLDHLLESSGQPGLPELRHVLNELLNGHKSGIRLVEETMLQPKGQRVFRVRFALDGNSETRSFIIKRLKPEIARRNELLANRWLPAVGLAGKGPPLLGNAAARSGDCVWHIYDDLGSWELNPREPDRARVEAAIDLIAQIHLRFARHALLGEVRLFGGDLGIHFYESNVRDAIYALEPWQPTPADVALRARLLERLYQLRNELPQRAEALAKWGGPETVLHGDLWAINVFVIDTATGPQARLIDWDHVSVGPASYDLSTFLLRFPAQHRRWILELYGKAVAHGPWHLPGEEELNLLFETHEYARYANRIIWAAIALVMDRVDWGPADLASIEQWFKEFRPVFERGTPVPTIARTLPLTPVGAESRAATLSA